MDREGPKEGIVRWTTLWGSQMWGMDTQASDRDLCTVYQLPHRKIVLGAFDPPALQPHRTGWHQKTAEGDEHSYEIGRVVQLLRKGSLTMLYGVISPVIVKDCPALSEMRALLTEQPSRAPYRALLRDVRDSEKAMKRAKDDAVYLKHLRIACRNLRFGVTLFTRGRFEFAPSDAKEQGELDALRAELEAAYEASSLPLLHDRRPFDDYLLRWREERYLAERDVESHGIA